MRQVPTALQTAILSPLGIRIVELWDFYLSDGVHHWCNESGNVTYSSTTWIANQVLVGKGQILTAVGTDTISLKTNITGPVTINGATLSQAALRAAFRGTRAVYQWLVYDSAGAAQGLFSVWDGRVTNAITATGGITLTITGALSSAGKRYGQMPIGVQCPWTVYSTQCGASVLQTTGTTTTGCTSTVLRMTATPASMGPGSQATLPDGTQALVRSVSGIVVTLDQVVPVLASGQTVTFKWGCPKIFAACRNKPNYAGAPWQPVKSLTT
jgi:hypothetical protein